MTCVIAIDVGIKNMGMAVFDFHTSQVVFWRNCSLVSGRYCPADNVKYVHEFVEAHKKYFDNARIVLVERQMRCNMRIVESVFESLFFGKVLIISPRSVKAHYQLSTRNYKSNKAKAVQWAELFVAMNGGAFAPATLQQFNCSKKQDDLADALLLVMYYLDTYSNQLTMNWDGALE